MIIMMKLCPLVEDNKSLAIKGHCTPQAQTFFSQKKKLIYSRLTCHQVFSEGNLHSSHFVTPFPKYREDATINYHTATPLLLLMKLFAQGDPAVLQGT